MFEVLSNLSGTEAGLATVIALAAGAIGFLSYKGKNRGKRVRKVKRTSGTRIPEGYKAVYKKGKPTFVPEEAITPKKSIDLVKETLTESKAIVTPAKVIEESTKEAIAEAPAEKKVVKKKTKKKKATKKKVTKKKKVKKKVAKKTKKKAKKTTKKKKTKKTKGVGNVY